MRVIHDLHSHTHYSDGRLSPAELFARAKARQVGVLAVTDHDTIAGLQSAQAAALEQGIGFVAGIEFSCRWGKVNVHVLGLAIDPQAAALIDAVQQQEDARRLRSEEIAQRLVKLGFPDALEGARAIAGDAVVGRPHFAQYLVACGAVKDINTAFKKYLGAGKPADVKYEWPAMEQALGWIHASGGLAVLAHPAKYDLTRTRMCRLIAEFAEMGGDGLEVVNGQQPAPLTQDLAKIAQHHGLYGSCGSDFHFPDQPWQELGQFSHMPSLVKPIWEAPGFYA
ncbi:PHP domain-containing protein [Cellvibrio japonicus]|nr:PHP domain-containing protein [Cellvibrio japonicus]QEI17727.1 PHP domain-containing protein [Cellvibrio japonicus]QEI21302.1 PHP domain-containing protein [Cellvibrio japonicus]